MMNQQIFELLDQAGKLSSQIQTKTTNKKHLSVDIMECVSKLQRIKISVNYRTKDSGLTSKEEQAIEEICQMTVEAEIMVKRMQNW